MAFIQRSLADGVTAELLDIRRHEERCRHRQPDSRVAPSVPPGEILLGSAVRPERCWMSTARASCAAWGKEVEGPVIAQPDRRAARNCGDVRPVRECSIA